MKQPYLVWGLRLLGIKQATRVYGPDLMLAWCERAAQYQLPLFFYGGTEALLETLIPILQNRYPHLAIAGYYAMTDWRILMITSSLIC